MYLFRQTRRRRAWREAAVRGGGGWVWGHAPPGKFRTLCGAFRGIVLLAVQRRYNAACHTHKIHTTCANAAFHGSAQISIPTKIDVAPLTSLPCFILTMVRRTRVYVRRGRGQTHRAHARCYYRRSMHARRGPGAVVCQ